MDDKWLSQFKLISSNIVTLAELAENKEKMKDSEEVLFFHLEMNRQINKLYSLRDDVLRFYQK